MSYNKTHSLKKSFTNRQAQDRNFQRYNTQLKTIFHYLTTNSELFSKVEPLKTNRHE